MLSLIASALSLSIWTVATHAEPGNSQGQGETVEGMESGSEEEFDLPALEDLCVELPPVHKQLLSVLEEDHSRLVQVIPLTILLLSSSSHT